MTSASGPHRGPDEFLEDEEKAVSQDDAINLPDGVKIAEFRPIAYFDRNMDCIRVLTHDCSVTEHRISEFFTVFEPNYRTDFSPKYVGFTIKGVKQLFHDAGIPFDGTHKLVDIIDKLVKYRPGSTLSAMIDLIFTQIRPGDLSINLDHAA
jgi:hypothetical protein